MVKFTGYALQHAIRRAKTTIEFAQQQFNDNLTYFESDPVRRDPTEAFATFERGERRLAALKTVQAQYNLSQRVKFRGESITLHEAISLIGVYGKAENMWKQAAKSEKDRGFLGRANQRDKDAEYVKRAVPVEDAIERAGKLAMDVGELKAGVNAANLQELDLEIPAGLLD